MRNFFRRGNERSRKTLLLEGTERHVCRVVRFTRSRREVEDREEAYLGGESFLGSVATRLSLSPLGIIRVVSGRQFITRWVTTLARSDALLARNSAVGARIVRQDRAECEVSVVGGVPEIVPHSCKTTSTKYHAMRFAKDRHFF